MLMYVILKNGIIHMNPVIRFRFPVYIMIRQSTLPVVVVDDDGGVLDPEEHGGVRLGDLVAELAGVAPAVRRHQLPATDPFLTSELERRQHRVTLVGRGNLGAIWRLRECVSC